MTKFDLSLHYSREQINHYMTELKKERFEWLRQFRNLNPGIVDTVKV
jgi:hypothetical protein